MESSRNKALLPTFGLSAKTRLSLCVRPRCPKMPSSFASSIR